MQIKALLVCIAVAAAFNVRLSAADQPGVPHGWTASPSVGKQYQVGYDNAETAAYIRADVDPGDAVGALSQAIDASPYVGRKVRFTAEVRNDSVQHVEVFLRAKGLQEKDGKFPSSFSIYTIDSAPGKWTPIKINMVLDEKPYKTLDYGLAIKGAGQVWMRNLKLEDTTNNPAVNEELAMNKPIANAIEVAVPIAGSTNLELRP